MKTIPLPMLLEEAAISGYGALLNFNLTHHRVLAMP
jgi:hypothetical protein